MTRRKSSARFRHEGYAQVDTEIAADLILYNTCSIRDKAEQKVFNRLNDYKKLYASGKRFVVLGCVAQQEVSASSSALPMFRWFPDRLVPQIAGDAGSPRSRGVAHHRAR